MAAFKIAGNERKSVYNYSSALAEVPELKRFQINNARKRFILATNELVGTGIPASGEGGTRHDLSILVDVPTVDGNHRLTTTVELKRPTAESKNWKR